MIVATGLKSPKYMAIYHNPALGLLNGAEKVDEKGTLRGYCQSMKNFYNIRGSALRSVRGYSDELSVAITGTPTITSGFDFKDVSGNQKTIVTTSDGKVRLYDGTDCDTELLTGLTSGSSLVWNWTVFDNGTKIYAIGCNGTDIIKTDGTAGDTAALSGTPPTAPQWVAVWKKRVWASDGNYIYYSAILNQDSWDTTNDYFPFIDDNDYSITGLVVYNDMLHVFKQRSIYRIIHEVPTQVDEAAFSTQKLPTNIGCDNGNTIVYLEFTNEIEFKYREDYARLKGSSAYPVGGIYTEEYFNPNLDGQQINRSSSLYSNSKILTTTKQIFSCIPVNSSVNNKGLIHDYRKEKPAWFPTDQYDFHCLFNYESSGRDYLLAGGIGDGMLYRLDNAENYDDSAIECEAIYLWDCFGSWTSLKQGHRIEFLYEDLGESSFTVGLAKDGDIANEVTRSITVTAGSDTWGTGDWGTFLWTGLGKPKLGYCEFEPHPDTGDTGLGEFKLLRPRIYKNVQNRPLIIYGFAIFFDVIGEYARR